MEVFYALCGAPKSILYELIGKVLIISLNNLLERTSFHVVHEQIKFIVVIEDLLGVNDIITVDSM